MNAVNAFSEVRGRWSPRLNFPGGTLFNWVKRSEVTPVEFPWGNPIQLGKEVGDRKSGMVLKEMICKILFFIWFGLIVFFSVVPNSTGDQSFLSKA